MFVPLHVKSDCSLGFGTAGVSELVRRAARLGYQSLALTDLENLYGQVRFQHECRRHGLHPITGVELRRGFGGQGCPGEHAGRLVLLALDASGYRSLCRIVSLRRCGREVLGADPVISAGRHPEGLLALSDDPDVLERLLAGKAFPAERLGLLLPRPFPYFRIPAATLAHCTARGVRIVADLDAVFLRPADHALHTLQLAVAKGGLLAEAAGSPDLEHAGRWLRSVLQVQKLFSDVPQALHNSVELARLCRFELGTEQTVHPFGFGSAADDHRVLTRLCEAALAQREGAKREPSYRRRLAAELEVFQRLGFSGFMLAVADILRHCREEGVPVAARGSAVSSLVLHLLGGSSVDPVAQGLLFERFLHPGKSAWPDVDIDLPWHRRDQVIDWVYRHFGSDRVAMVAAHHTFQLRSALREGLKACNVPLPLIDRLTASVPAEDADYPEPDFLAIAGAGAGVGAGEDGSRPAPELGGSLALVRRLVGRPRHVAVHPGGVVIDRHPLAETLPLERAAKGIVMTQYDLVAVAQLGLVKIDLLGNRCLSEIDETMVLSGWPQPVRMSDLPENDGATLEMIDRARTIGCFQLESPAMRSLLARLPIRRQSDLTAALALIRPGAASGEVKESFLRRARGEERADLAFPSLADRLAESYGLLIYEEDIMVLLHRSGGLSLAEADEMRRGIVKCGADPKALSALQDEFLEKTRRYLGQGSATLARARRAWSVAARFAAYSFNKAHAASYALLSYYSAYLKAHHPVEFACALMNHHQGLYPLRIEASELVRGGVTLLGPHVNGSQYRSTVVDASGKAVQVGLDKVKRLSQRAARQLPAERQQNGPFPSLAQLLARVRLTAAEVQALVLCGACDGLYPLSREEYPFPHEAAVQWLLQGGEPKGLDALRYRHAVAETKEQAQRLRLYQGLVRAKNELAYLEMHLAAHPMALLRREAQRCGCSPIAAAEVASGKGRLRLAAVIGAMRRVQTRQGVLLFLTLEDETGLLEGVLMPDRYRALATQVTTPGPFLVEGMLRSRQGAPHLEVTNLKPFHERSRP